MCWLRQHASWRRLALRAQRRWRGRCAPGACGEPDLRLALCARRTALRGATPPQPAVEQACTPAARRRRAAQSGSAPLPPSGSAPSTRRGRLARAAAAHARARRRRATKRSPPPRAGPRVEAATASEPRHAWGSVEAATARCGPHRTAQVRRSSDQRTACGANHRVEGQVVHVHAASRLPDP